jgi:hypothetical protein
MLLRCSGVGAFQFVIYRLVLPGQHQSVDHELESAHAGTPEQHGLHKPHKPYKPQQLRAPWRSGG